MKSKTLLTLLGCLLKNASCFLFPALLTTRSTTSIKNASNDGIAVPMEVMPPVGSLRPPEPIHSLKVGDKICAFRRKVGGEHHDFTLTRIAQDPHIFFLENFLSEEECNMIQNHVNRVTMGVAQTVTQGDKESRKNCKVAWIKEVSDAPLVKAITQSVASMFLSPIILKDSKSGVEDMQVLEYQTGGEFILHHDGHPRVLTVIYYLNGTGGTWFPLACTNTVEVDEGACSRRPLNKAQAMKLCEDLKVGQDGLLVGDIPNASPGYSFSVTAGDAVAFYNYCDNGSGRVNWNAIHAGLPVKSGVKWIANQWFQFGTFKTSHEGPITNGIT